MAAGREQGIGDAVAVDLRRMHETWMEFVFPRQREAEGTVLGKWKPQGGPEAFAYKLWSALGVPVVGLVYPFVLLGYVFRFQTRRLNLTAERLGIVGVVLLFVVLWGVVSLLAKFQFADALSAGGVTAIVAASAVAVLSAALAYGTWSVGGRVTTVLLAYPLGVTAIFLPPVVAALYSNAVAEVVLTQSDSIARWFLNEGPALFGLKDYLVTEFEREGFAYVLMWFGISVPVGWVLGLIVTLADLVRPTEE